MTTVPTRGYTLIELIVSVAIFSIVMLVASAAFLTLISLDRKARATNDVVTNLSYVVDSMERAIRTGTGYSCASGGDCWPTPRSQLSFTDSSGRSVTYSLVLTGTKGQVQECVASTCMVLTDPRIDVESLDFYVRGTQTLAQGNQVQPTVVVSIRGLLTPGPQDPVIDFVIESGATQRLIDL